jgi:hypothetical protein
MSADNPWLTIPLADYEAHMALPRLELHVTDLERAQLDLAPVELVFAALVLEYVEPESAPKRLVRLAARSGLRASDTRTVTATGGKRFAVQSFARG